MNQTNNVHFPLTDRPIRSIMQNPFEELLLMQQEQAIMLDKIMHLLENNHALTAPERMSVVEAGKFLDMSISTIYKMTALKLIPFHKREGSNKLVFNREELITWMEKGEPVALEIGRSMMLQKVKKSYIRSSQ